MTAIVDFHVHLYPDYDFGRVIDSFEHHCSKRFPDNPSVSGVMCLTERAGESWFADVVAGKDVSPSFGDLELIPTPDGLALEYRSGNRSYFLVCGRQIVTKEGLELLCLGRDLIVEDRTFSALNLIEKVRSAGGIAVLPWALGKWWFSRGKVVKSLLEQDPTLFLGETTLRPSIIPDGSIIRHARHNDLGILPGSDPLPIRDEEEQVGRLSTEVGIPCILPGSELVELLSGSKLELINKPPCVQVSLWDVIRRSIALRIER